MKFLRNRKLKSLIIIPVIIMALFNLFVPTKVEATTSREPGWWNFGERVWGSVKGVIGWQTNLSGDSSWGWEDIGGNLLKEIMYMITGIGDVIISLLQVTMIGDSDFWASTMIQNKNQNLDNPNSWLYADDQDVTALQNGETSSRGTMLIEVAEAGMKNGIFFGDYWQVPNILYSPEMIFSNRIAALDANFINPNEFTAVSDSDEAEKEAQSLAKEIAPTIASWYRAFRNIAIVGLLTILVYMGIRIVIGSTAAEKAKYKERIQDWFIALCLVFFMHFIMAAIMTFVDLIIGLFDGAANSGIIVAVDDGTIFRTNFTGFIRFAAQSNSWKESLGYGIMYIIIIGLIVRFTFIYLKRFLYLAFFTMISPLIALTYPLDKLSDAKAQAYNKWFKEYFINAMLQPMHLILYTAFVSSASMLCVKNPIYAIVVMMFMTTAEKWIKNLFRMDEAKLSSTTMADVAMMSGIARLGSAAVKTVGTVAGAVAGGPVGAKIGSAIAGGVSSVGGAIGGLFGSGSTVQDAVDDNGGAPSASGVPLDELDTVPMSSGGEGTQVSTPFLNQGGDSNSRSFENTSRNLNTLGVQGTQNIPGTEEIPLGDGGIDEGILELANIDDGLYSEMNRDSRNMATDRIRSQLNIPEGLDANTNNSDLTANLESQNIQNLDDEILEDSEDSTSSSNAPNSSLNAPNASSLNLADQISQGVVAGLKTVLDARDQESERKQKEKEEKEKEEEEQQKQAKRKEELINAAMAVPGAFVGAVGGIAISAARGEDYGKTIVASSLTGMALGGKAANAVDQKVIDKIADIYKEKENENLEKLIGAVSKADLNNPSKVKMMKRAASVATDQNWSTEKMVATYQVASAPEYKNIKNNEVSSKAFEQFIKDHNPDATDRDIKKAKRDIENLQKEVKKVKKRRGSI